MEETNITSSGRKPLVVENLTFLPSDSCDLTEHDLEKARVELHETDELTASCLQKLKLLLANDTDVRYRTDEAYLMRFLRVRKFDCDKAYKTIKDFYDVRDKHPDVFALPPNLESLLNLNFYTCLPYADEEGRILFKTDFEKWKPSEVSFTDILSLMIVVSDITTLNPRMQINGIIGIWDMKGMSASHFAEFIYPRRILLFFKILQGCYPWRIKMIIGVNCGHFSQLFYKAVQPFVKTKIIERVVLLGSDMSDLHKYVNPAVLPKQFGGQLEDSECGISQNVLNNMEYLNYERSFGCNKSD